MYTCVYTCISQCIIVPLIAPIADTLYIYIYIRIPPAPMNHVKYLRAGPAEMPFQNWYTANTNHLRLTDSVRWKSKRQLG